MRDRRSSVCLNRPLMLPEVFDESGNFDEWTSHFESVSVINKWNDEEKLQWLKVQLTGKAHVAFNRLSRAIQHLYADTKQALHNRFEHASKHELYKVELEQQNKLFKKSWADFGDCLSELAS